MEGFSIVKYTVLSLCVLAVYALRVEGQSPCSEHTACDQCIRNECSWCNDNENGNTPRCMGKTDILRSHCQTIDTAKPSEFVVQKSRKVSIVEPQAVRLFLNYGSPVTIPVEIKIPANIRKQSTLILKYHGERSTYKQSIKVDAKKSRAFKKGKKSLVTIKNLDAASTIQMNVTLELSKCQVIKQKSAIVVRLVQKTRKPIKYKFKILLRSECPCSCQDIEEKSPRCSQQGRYECGICTCDPGFMGRKCERDSEPNKMCMQPGSIFVCNGRGNCVDRSFCECYPVNPPVLVNQTKQRYSGAYCECDDFHACPYGANNKRCGGNGRCLCGDCVCDMGFVGDACECPTSSDTCRASNGMVCNGAGTCECGACRCEGSNRGPTCEECPTCESKCSKLRPCAECIGFGTGEYNARECQERCSDDLTPFTVMSYLPHAIDEKQCLFSDDEGCIFKFSYQEVPISLGLMTRTAILSKKDCPAPL